jgi:hypothetical protein
MVAPYSKGELAWQAYHRSTSVERPSSVNVRALTTDMLFCLEILDI